MHVTSASQHTEPKGLTLMSDADAVALCCCRTFFECQIVLKENKLLLPGKSINHSRLCMDGYLCSQKRNCCSQEVFKVLFNEQKFLWSRNLDAQDFLSATVAVLTISVDQISFCACLFPCQQVFSQNFKSGNNNSYFFVCL